MGKAWANSLDLHVDPGCHRTRAAVEAALRDAVRSGGLAAGTRLPPSRALAADLGAARNTVAEAYSQLVAEGWLSARTGAGTWVADRPGTTPHPLPAPSPEVPPSRFDLRPGVPNLASFPRAMWVAALKKSLNDTQDGLLGYPDPRGLAPLRHALARYLARARGVMADPERIVVCAGFASGLALLGRVLHDRGTASVGMEACGHQVHRRIVAAQGLRPVTLDVDAAGARTAGLTTLGAALLTPAHQFPLGVTLHPRRRRDFTRWATDTGGPLIEDDYDGEFRYDRQPVGALQALSPDHVVYAGTASKSLAPGVRLGWLVVPHALLDEVVAAKEVTGESPGSLDQLALAHLLTSGGYDRQIRSARLVYRRRRDQLVTRLASHVPQARVSGIAAGLHALVELPAGLDEATVTACAAGHGLTVEGLGAYSATGSQHPPALVVGYSRPPDHAFTSALTRLLTALAEALR